MVIKYKNFEMTAVGDLDSFNLEIISTKIKDGKETFNKKVLGYGFTLQKAISVFIIKILEEKFDEISLKDFLLEYKKTYEEIKNEVIYED